MKRIILIAIALIALLGAAYFTASSKQTSETTPSTSQKLPSDIKIYDVRTQEEYDAGHIEGATLLPDYAIANGSYPDVPKDTPIAVYCRSGNRSASAVANLKAAGYTNITDLGGLTDIQVRGYTLVTN